MRIPIIHDRPGTNLRGGRKINNLITSGPFIIHKLRISGMEDSYVNRFEDITRLSETRRIFRVINFIGKFK